MSKSFWPEIPRISDDTPLEGHGAAILLLIREGRARSWEKLCRVFKFDPQREHSGHFELRSAIRELIAAGFIQTKNDWRGPYRITDRVEQIYAALNLSLVEAANLTPYDAMAVRPRFGPRPEPSDSAHVFALMPFADAFAPVYKTIQSAARTLRLSVQRADELSSTGTVMEDIWKGICNSGVLVADCTGRNPNVFYEIGIAHTVGHPVILIAQEEDDIPFDIASLRHIRYRQDRRGLAQLSRDLQKVLAAVRDTAWTA